MAVLESVFFYSSTTGGFAKCQSPQLLAAMAVEAEFAQIAKAAIEGSGSKALRARYGTNVGGLACAARPFDFALYAYASTLNTYHNRAVRAKVKDITGRGWTLNGDASELVKAQVRERLEWAFGGDMSFGDGLAQVWTDYEATGNGYLEVVNDAKGVPVELAHVPAPEMYVRLDGLGFVQQREGKHQHFRKFGVDREVYQALSDRDPLRAEDATSVIHFARYFSYSPYYGLPPVMPAFNALTLMVLIREFNLRFFANNAIPDYLIRMKGSWSDTAVHKIREYFRTHLKGNSHQTMVLEIPELGDVTIEKLTSDAAREGSFRLLWIDCRDEILHAHGVPPQKVGIVETGKLGGNLASEQMSEYAESTVRPGQKRVSDRMTRIARRMAGADTIEFAFEPYLMEDQKLQMDIDRGYLADGVVTPGEVRAQRYPELPELPGADVPLPDRRAVPMVEEALEAVQRMAREAAR